MTHEQRIRALELMAGSLTKGGIDRTRAVLAIRADPHYGFEIVRDARRRWLDWLTVSQRKWQSGARTYARERSRLLHGAWEPDHPRLDGAIREHLNTRERYVRCES